MTSRPCILHVSTAHTWRGGEQQIAYLYEELDRLGMQQTILCSQGSALAERAARESWRHKTAPKKGSISIAYARVLAQLSKHHDIIHIHDSHGHNNAVLSTFLGNKKPMVLHRRVDFPVSRNIFSAYKYNHPQIARIICVSDAIREVMKPAIRDNARLTTIHSGIDTGRRFEADGRLRKEFGVAPDTLLIGNVAALAPHKDYFTFLRTAARLKDKLNARYFIIGEGDLRPQIEQEIRRLNLQDHVVMTGFRNDISAVLAELDIFLVTSETEGLGTSILDAFMAGVPVVATAAGGIPEIVQHENTGLLSAVKDDEQLAELVIRLAGDDALKKGLMARAKVRVNDFSKERMAQQTMQQYLFIIR